MNNFILSFIKIKKDYLRKEFNWKEDLEKKSTFFKLKH